MPAITSKARGRLAQPAVVEPGPAFGRAVVPCRPLAASNLTLAPQAGMGACSLSWRRSARPKCGPPGLGCKPFGICTVVLRRLQRRPAGSASSAWTGRSAWRITSQPMPPRRMTIERLYRRFRARSPVIQTGANCSRDEKHPQLRRVRCQSVNGLVSVPVQSQRRRALCGQIARPRWQGRPSISHSQLNAIVETVPFGPWSLCSNGCRSRRSLSRSFAQAG